jgi:hypothetical protein
VTGERLRGDIREQARRGDRRPDQDPVENAQSAQRGVSPAGSESVRIVAHDEQGSTFVLKHRSSLHEKALFRRLQAVAFV